MNDFPEVTEPENNQEPRFTDLEPNPSSSWPRTLPLWPLHKIQPANCRTTQHARITYSKWAQPLNSLVTLTPAWIWLPNCARQGHVQNNEVIPDQKNTCLGLNKPHKQRDTWCPLISNKDTSLQKTHSSADAYGDCRIQLALSGTHWRWPVCSVPQQHLEWQATLQTCLWGSGL